MKQAELHPAYLWNCDSCGRENVFRVPQRNLSQDEIRESLVEAGELEEWEEMPEGEYTGVQVMGIPTQVQCEFCDAEFEALTPEFSKEEE